MDKLSKNIFLWSRARLYNIQRGEDVVRKLLLNNNPMTVPFAIPVTVSLLNNNPLNTRLSAC